MRRCIHQHGRSSTTQRSSHVSCLILQVTLISSWCKTFKKCNRDLHNYCQGNPKPVACGLRILDVQLSFAESRAFSNIFIGCLWSIKVSNGDHTGVRFLLSREDITGQCFCFRFLFRRYPVLISVDTFSYFSPASPFLFLVFSLRLFVVRWR
jgi:hypothetical protein